MEQAFLTVGKIVNTHGIRGEVKIWPSTDFPELRFRKDGRLMIEMQEGQPMIEVEVEAARDYKNTYIVKFKGVHDINDVEKYKGATLKVPQSERAELAEGEYYYHQIVGCEVLTEEGESLGTIAEILTPGANDVWVVRRPKGSDLLLPYIDDVVLAVDVAKKQVRIRLMEGLL